MMRDISERGAVRPGWDEVRGIVSDEIRDILGLQIQCRINIVEGSFWDVTLIGQRLPLPKLCQLLQVTQATPEDWEDALPDEGGVDVNSIGIVLAEKLIERHLNLPWEHHLITEDSLCWSVWTRVKIRIPVRERLVRELFADRQP